MNATVLLTALALAASGWSRFTTEVHVLRWSDVDAFYAATDSGALKLPSDVTVVLSQNFAVQPTLTVSGERPSVDKAMAVIGAWDHQRKQILIGIELGDGAKVFSSPILRTLDGQAAMVVESANGTSFAVRVCPKLDDKQNPTARVLLGTSLDRVLLPFTFGPQEELTFALQPNGTVMLTAKDVDLNKTSMVLLPDKLKPLVGMKVKVKLSVIDGHS